MDLNNPAARLHHWLSMARPKGLNDPPNSALALWCDIWGLQQSVRADEAECLRRGLNLMQAAVETRRLAEASVSPMAVHGLSTFHQVEGCVQYFSVLPRVNCQEFFQYLNDDGLLGLGVLATMLGIEAPEPTISPEQEASLLDRTRRLVDVVMAAEELSDEDKVIILEHLRAVEDALIHLTVSGAAEVRRAADGLMGAMLRLWMRGLDVSKHPATKAVFGLIAAIFAVVGVTADYSAIADSGFGDLLGLPGGTDISDSPSMAEDGPAGE